MVFVPVGVPASEVAVGTQFSGVGFFGVGSGGDWVLVLRFGYLYEEEVG